ncbi:MAG: glycoside hydrolase family 88 protein [Saprospiraceae bacterium]|nr:glycoside hydrolase family 88 protein [Saprospiraceae bacterium]
MSKLLVVFIIIIFTSQVSFSQHTDWAIKIATTIMKNHPDSMVMKRPINQFDQEVKKDEFEKPRPANWNYEMGVVLTGFERLWQVTRDPKYYDYIQHIMDKYITEDGNILTYNMGEYNSDFIPPGRQLLLLHQTKNIKKYKVAADILRNQIAWMPRNQAGGFWHKLRYPSQIWLDGLYMVEPFYANYAQMTGQTEAFDDIAHQFITMEKYSRDEKTGLLYHGWDESKYQQWANKKDGKSPEFWSRAMGWYAMGIVDVLDYFPTDHPERQELINILNRLSTALVKYQDPVSGVWWQVTDKGGQQGNYLESSGTAMFLFSMAKGVRMGYLPESYLPAIKKGYDGMIKTFVETDAEGMTHFTKTVGGAGLGGTPYRDGSYQYYISEPTRDDDFKAVGPFMQACIEMDLLQQLNIGKGKIVLLDNYFNNEYKNGVKYHYLWHDRFDPGFSILGTIFNDYGAKTATLAAAPTAENLKSADIYIIVDPDTKKETENPNFIQTAHIKAITDWVKAGGVLVLMANDSANVELPHFNELAKTFGITFTNKSRNMVQGTQFEQGKIMVPKGHPIFKGAKKLYIKELSVLSVQPPAKASISDGADVIIATAQIGKGTVFAVGDPWLYNEYVHAKKLPVEFENFEAAKNLAEWLLKQVK